MMHVTLILEHSTMIANATEKGWEVIACDLPTGRTTTSFIGYVEFSDLMRGMLHPDGLVPEDSSYERLAEITGMRLLP